jgi:hypothetical protein
MRNPLLAEICRRLEDDPPANAVVREWTYGMIFAALVRLAGRRRAKRHPSILTPKSLERVPCHDRLPSPAHRPHERTMTWPLSRVSEQAGSWR